MGMSASALFSAPDRPRTLSRPVVFAFASAATLLLLLALNSHSSHLLVGIAAVAISVVACYGVVYTARHNEWLIFTIALLFLLIEISFLNNQVRAAFHYVILALLCVPVLPKVWRSGILHSGGFKLYAFYFGWAALTITYSLAPLYSVARLGETVMVTVALGACVLEIHESGDVTRLLSRFLLACGVMLAMLAVASAILPHSVTWASPLESYTPEELANMSKEGISAFGMDRFRGLLNGPNDVGGLLLIVVGSALVCWRVAARRERLMLAAMIMAALGFDVLADSRSAFVAIAFGGALFVMWKWRLRGVLLCSAALAVAAAVMLHAGMLEYIKRGDVTTLTGRTDMWEFVVQQIRERPMLGWGYATSGAVFESKFFPLWWGPWNLGPQSSLHNGYLEHAIGVGIPASMLWLFIVLRPWVFALRQKEDPWNLKPMFFLIVIPILVNNFSEQLLNDFGAGIVAFLFGLTWAIAERHRIVVLRTMKAQREAAHAALPKAVSVLASA
jgi:O-antigen ligase